jgi:heat shock protein 5
LTLGIHTVGGVMSKLISRNSRIPITETKPFTTADDDQQSVSVEIYEGERSMTKDNHFLGKFELTGIPLAPRGLPEIEVTFDIDVNGILNVSVLFGNDIYEKKKISILLGYC